MNPVSFQEVAQQFTLSMEKTDVSETVKRVDLLEEFREAMDNRTPEKKTLKSAVKRLLTKDNSNKAFHSALESNPEDLLLTASIRGYTKLAVLIIQQNGSRYVNGTNIDFQQTPLHLSCKYGNGQTAQQLLKFGANPNQQDTFGNTPLHYASESESPKLATFLVKKGGANPFIVNNEKKTPARCITPKALKIMHKPLKASETPFLSVLPRDIRYLIYGLLSFDTIRKNLRSVSRDSYNTVSDDILHILKVQK